MATYEQLQADVRRAHMAASKGKRKHWFKVAVVAGLVYIGFRVVEEKGVKPKLARS